MEFDVLSAAGLDNPYPHYARLREEAPVFYDERRDVWLLTRYRDVADALRDYSAFSSEEGIGYERSRVPLMITSDPPVHTRLRRTVSTAFSPRTVAALEDSVRALVRNMVEPLVDGDPHDIATELARPLPIRVIAEVLGVAAEDFEQLLRWTDHAIAALSGGATDAPADEDEIWDSIGEAFGYFIGRLRDPLRDSDAHLLDALAQHVPAELEDFEFASFCILLLVAGTETTSNFITNALLGLEGNEDAWHVLRRQDDVAGAVEEILRYDAPIHGFFRTTRAPVTLHGRTIPSDARVLVSYGAANRDPDLVTDPDRLDLTRPPAPHLAFGSGIHHCLGAHLARLEGRVVLDEVRRRARKLELAGPVGRTSSPFLRGARRLPMVLHPVGDGPV